MSVVYVGNSFNETLVDNLSQFDPEERKIGGNLSCRLVWLMSPGDVLVCPQRISDEFLGYASRLKGVTTTSADIVVPPPGEFGEDVLTADRLRGVQLLDLLKAVHASRGIDRIVPYCYDQTIAALARKIGLDPRDPSFAFCEAGGADLLNRKSVFRALCGGSSIPIPEGLVIRSVDDATDFVWGLIDAGRSAIIKQDAHQGGFGNEILAPSSDVLQLGAAGLTVVQSRSAVADRLQHIWARCNSGGRDPVVVERYLEDSVSLGCEVDVAGASAVMRHTVEMRMTPVFDGFFIPPVSVPADVDATFSRYGLELANVVHKMGYRGLINIDGLASRDGVVLNELNGRLGGSTHLHWIAETFLGDDYLRKRYLLSNNDLHVASFSNAIEALAHEKIEFEPGRGEGVILTCDHTAQSGAVEYCVVAPDADRAVDYERRVRSLTSGDRSG